jgi:hypothetical protein
MDAADGVVQWCVPCMLTAACVALLCVRRHPLRLRQAQCREGWQGHKGTSRGETSARAADQLVIATQTAVAARAQGPTNAGTAHCQLLKAAQYTGATHICSGGACTVWLLSADWLCAVRASRLCRCRASRLSFRSVTDMSTCGGHVYM